MEFIKEYLSAENATLLNQLEIFDYDREDIRKFGERDCWLVERDEKIYFVYVGGSGNLEQAPQQYDLIWKDKKVVIFKDNYSSYNTWNLCGIYAPTEFKSIETALTALIKIVLEENHKMYIAIQNTEKFTVNNFEITYRDEVK